MKTAQMHSEVIEFYLEQFTGQQVCLFWFDNRNESICGEGILTPIYEDDDVHYQVLQCRRVFTRSDISSISRLKSGICMIVLKI